MIQINAITNTIGGIELPTGILLNVTPHFLDYVDDGGLTKYDVTFDVAIYKDMTAYLAGDKLINSRIQEFNIGYHAKDVDIQTLTSVSDLIGLLATHIEDGDSDHSGVGTGNTAIIFPPVV